MAGPTARESHIDTALTNVAIAYRNSAYIFDQIFPIVPVAKQSGKYFIFDGAAWYRDEVGVRAPGTKAARAHYTLSTSPYVCVEMALAHQITDDVVDNSDDPLRPLVTGTEYVTDQVMKQQERTVIGKVFGTGWTSSATPGTLWSDDSSDPWKDINVGMETVAKLIGREPNIAVMGRGLYTYWVNHPDVVDRIKGGAVPGNPAAVGPALFTAITGIPKLLVTTAILNSAEEGATASLAFIGGKHMWLGYVTPNASIDSPTAGYMFQWKGRQVNRYREDQEHADVVECLVNYGVYVTAPDAGYLIKQAVAA